VVLLQNVIGYPFDPVACGNRDLHATQSMLAIYCWENFFSNKKMAARLKIPFTIRGPYTGLIKAYPKIPLSGRSNLVRRDL
jgi:hypothetical protein